MIEYCLDIKFESKLYGESELNFKDFENCTFSRCNFSRCTFLSVTFIDCIFLDCIFSGAKINYVAFRTATFKRCEIKDVNFAMCDKLIFDIAFANCVLDFSKFYTLKMKGTTFTDCSLVAVDFMNVDLTGVLFQRCDLYRAEFARANATKSDFRTSFNYTIDPESTKLKGASFALSEAKGLLSKYDILVE